MDICLLVDAESPRWFHSSIQQLVKQESDVSVKLIVKKRQTEGGDKPQSQSDNSLVKKHVYQKLKHKMFLNPAEKSPVAPDQFNSQPEVIEIEPERVGKYRWGIPNKVLDRISEECDIIIQNHFGILTGNVLDATEYGVLSAHWGNVRKYRGSHPGLWQILHDENEMTLTAQRLTEKLDGGELIYEHRIDISDISTPRGVKEAAYEESKHLYPEAINRIKDPSTSFYTVPESELGENYRTSMVDNKIKLKLVWKILTRFLRNRLAR